MIFMIFWLVAVGLLLLLTYIAKRKFEKTAYYSNMTKEVKKFMEGVPASLDYINLGTTYSKYAFDWNGLSGFNFAIAPQTVGYDLRILKTYADRIHQDTIVCIPIQIFSFCVNMYREEWVNNKYYFFLKDEYIENYSFIKRIRYKVLPFFADREALLFLCKKTTCDEEQENNDRNIANKDAAITLGIERKANWWKSFGFSDELQKNISDKKDEFALTRSTISEMIKLVRAKKGIPVIVVMPFYELEADLYTPEEVKCLLWDNFEKITGNYNVDVINFWRKTDLMDWHLYYENGCLNCQGQEVFNRLLREDLKHVSRKKV